MSRSRWPILLAALMLVPPACGPRSADREPEPVEYWCLGRPLLIVRNNSGSSVEITEHRRGSTKRTTIGFAGPGTSTFTISPRSDYYYSARLPDRSGVAGTESRRRGTDDVQFTRECEP